MLNPTYSSCKLHCYGGQLQLDALSRNNPVVAAAHKHAKVINGNTQNYNTKSKGNHIETPNRERERDHW